MRGFAAATGVGSWPGTSPREAAEVVVGELHKLPYLVELPARGVGADLIGRAGALLVDIAIDTVPRGYRIATGRTSVTRRATSLLAEDIDALEEAWEKAGLRGLQRTVKVQTPGPITLAAQVELANGHRAITDRGAMRDVAGSLAEGVALHRAEVARRLECPVVVQFDEPSLPAALEGRLTGVTSLSPVHPVDESVAAGLLDDCVVKVGGEVAIHSCAPRPPWTMLQRGTVSAVSVDLSTLTADDFDGVGEFVESGRTVMIGVVPATTPDRRWSDEETAKSVVAFTDRLGFPRSVLPERIGLTPACGLAGATLQWARTAMELVQKAADVIADDPAAILELTFARQIRVQQYTRTTSSSATPLVREGIVAQSTVRFAASAGVVAASLLILGPFPALAVADKGGSGSHSRDDDRGNRSNGRGNVLPRPGPDLINEIADALDVIEDRAPSVEGPGLMDLGTDSNDLGTFAITTDSVENFSIADGGAALRSAAVENAPSASRSAAVEELPSVNASGAVPRSTRGSDYAGPPAVSVKSPRVVIGNGRSPGLQYRDSKPAPETPITPEIVPVVPEAIEVTAPPVPPPPPPVERIQPPRPVFEKMGTAKTDTTTDPLFGLAGLILIPAVGAALGYRQARAAQTARESVLT